MSRVVTLNQGEVRRLRDALLQEKEARLRRLELDAAVISSMYVSPWRSGSTLPGGAVSDALETLDDYIVTE